MASVLFTLYTQMHMNVHPFSASMGHVTMVCAIAPQDLLEHIVRLVSALIVVVDFYF